MISITLLVVLFYFVDLEALFLALTQANYAYILAGVGVLLISLVVRAMAWRTLLLDQVSVQKSFFTLNEGYLLNNILPFRLGEIGRALLMSSTTALGFWQVIPTIFIERVFDVALTAGMLLMALPFAFGVDWAQQAAIVVGVMVLGALLALHLVARYRDFFMGLFERLSARFPILDKFGAERVESFFNGLAALTDLRIFLKAFGLMVLVWALTLVEYYLFLLAFVPDAQPIWAAFALGVVAMGVAVPSSPAYVGVFEAALVGALTVFDVDSAAALAFAITIHLIFIVVTAIFGIFGLVRDGQSLGQLYRKMRTEPEPEV